MTLKQDPRSEKGVVYKGWTRHALTNWWSLWGRWKRLLTVGTTMRNNEEQLKQTAHQPIYPVKVENTSTTALFDTGSTRSFIHPDLVCKVSACTQPTERSLRIVCANGTEIHPTSQVKGVEITYDRWKGKMDLLVARMGYPLLLGHDFLTRAKAIWDFGTGKLKIPPDKSSFAEPPLTWVPKKRLQSVKKDPKDKQKFQVDPEVSQTHKTTPGPPQKPEAQQLDQAHHRSRHHLTDQEIISQPPDSQHFMSADVRTWERPSTTTLTTFNQPHRRPEADIDVVPYGQFKQWFKRGQVEWMAAANFISPETNGDTLQQCFVLSNPTTADKLQSQPPELRQVLQGFQDIFQEFFNNGIKERVIKHHIQNRLPDYARQYYDLSDQHLHELKKQLRTLLEKNFIAPSQAPVAAPVFSVAKKDGGLRMTTHTPASHDLINRLGKAKWFSTLDLQQGYYQVEVAEEDQWKTVFRTRYGTYQFRMMPFGLAGAPATFQKPMQNILLEELDDFVIQLRGFLGLVGYYRRLIPNFNKFAHPLHRLLRDDSDMVWRLEHSKAVRALKEALINAATLKIFDLDKSITIKTDASKYAIGAVLEQEGVPVAFESRKLSGREQYMPAYEGELLAIVHALLKWRPFIGSKAVTIETDHATLGRILKQKNVTTRLGYWLDKLADFNINVVYKPGKQNVVADAISRRQDYLCLIHSNETQEHLPDIQNLDKWKTAYKKCKNFQLPFEKSVANYRKGRDSLPVLYLHREYTWDGKFLWGRTRSGWKVCVPEGEFRLTLLEQFHDHVLAGHPGIDKTRTALRTLFWWPKMTDDI
ncbi:retrotransposon ty3-gypsy subclass, partial [Cystoisospora suis]